MDWKRGRALCELGAPVVCRFTFYTPTLAEPAAACRQVNISDRLPKSEVPG